jgi:OmpR-family two-component system manganese-sensing response regulator
MIQILLVDDETELTQTLAQILESEGYQVDIADNGVDGLNLALSKPYDLFILDWMLPQKSGLEICQQLRLQSISTPVLFLTAKDTLDDRVLGLDVGADDYLVKPFELKELLARLRALLRRSGKFEASTSTPFKRLNIADLELDTENQLAYRQGRMISLSEKEVKLLQYLMLNSQQLLTQEQIYHNLWHNGDKPSSNVVAALIRLLRRKITLKNEKPLIHTVYGKGYWFGIKD